MTIPSTTPATPADDDARPLEVGIVLFDAVEPLDAIGPAQVFWSLASARPWLPPMPPVRVHLVGETGEPITAGYGLVLTPTVSYATCPPLDLVIIPGGTGGEVDDDLAHVGRRFQAHHPATLDFVRRQRRPGATLASVCTGAFILAGAGLLAGRRANTHWAARDELVTFMAERGEAFELVIDRVVDDGDLVTAGGVSSGIELALHLLGRELGDDCRELVASIIERETPGVPA